MRISFSPQRRDETLMLEKSNGDTLTINSELFNFNTLEDGGTIPAGSIPCEWIVGPVERIDGEIHLTLILPHGSNPSQAVAFPEPITVTEDGPINLPESSVSVTHVQSRTDEEFEADRQMYRDRFPYDDEAEFDDTDLDGDE